MGSSSSMITNEETNTRDTGTLLDECHDWSVEKLELEPGPLLKETKVEKVSVLCSTASAKAPAAVAQQCPCGRDAEWQASLGSCAPLVHC